MKKLLLLFTAAFTFTYSNSNAQSCTPNLPGPNGDIVPDTIVNLPVATEGQPYNTDIQFYVPADTFASGFNNTIVNYTLNSVTGMPSNFNYTTNPSNGVFPGDAAACLNLTGNPVIGQAGTYPLVVNVTANVLVNGAFPLAQPATINGYKIIINTDGTVGLSSNTADKFELGQNIPNPSSDITRISFTSPAAEPMELNIFNAIGQDVFNKTIDAQRGSNEEFIPTGAFADGIYIYTLRNSSKTLTKRMVVSKK